MKLQDFFIFLDTKYPVMYRIVIILLLSCSVGLTAHGRDKAVADSCLWVLENDTELSTLRQCELLLLAIHNTSDFQTCLELSEKLIEKAEEAKNPYYQYYGFYEKGQSLIFLNSSEEALTYLQNSLQIALDNNFQKEVGFSYYLISDVFRRKRSFAEAIEFLRIALMHLTSNENQKYLSIYYYQLGNIYYQISQNDSSKLYYKKAVKHFEAGNQLIEAAYTYGNIGAVYIRLNEPDSARYVLSRAFNILDETNNYYTLTIFNIHASKNELQSGNMDMATHYGLKALSLANKVQNAEINRDVYEHLALLYSSTGDYTKAYHYLKEFYTLRDSLVNMDVITRMANMRTEFEVGLKQAEVDKLTTYNQAAKRTIYLICAGLLIISVLLFYVIRAYQRNNNLNKKLMRQRRELERNKKNLEIANLSKDKLFSIISHDLRGPVGTISSLADMANILIKENEITEATEINQSIYTTSREVESLLNNLLHWSVNQQNIYQVRNEPVELVGLAKTVISVYGQTAKSKKIDLLLNAHQPEIKVEGDSNCWGTIIRNLVNNALKFTHENGQVTISLNYTNNRVTLEVTDNGIGMTEEQKSKLFVFTGTSREWGTRNERGQGLGLSLVSDFVKIYNGRIEVESQLGQGSTFRVIMPATAIQKQTQVTIEQEQVK